MKLYTVTHTAHRYANRHNDRNRVDGESTHTYFSEEGANRFIRANILANVRNRDSLPTAWSSVHIDVIDAPDDPVWVEEETEFVDHHTSYAADWRKLRTIPGTYDVKFVKARGIHHTVIGAPDITLGDVDYVAVQIDADVIEGKTYNGFAGLNYSSDEVEHKRVKYTRRIYAYQYHAWLSKVRERIEA